MTVLERMMARTGSADEILCEALLEDAQGMILAFTGRLTLPDALVTAQVQLAVVLYNRQGTEGETSHSEGGVSRAMEAVPEEIRRQIAPYRIAKVVNMHAAAGA